MDLGVKDKVALILGGGEGVGQIVALMLAEEGAHISLADLDVSKVEESSNKVRTLGVKSKWFPVDVTDQEQVNAVVQKTLDEFKRIDILVHIPGRGERKSFLDTTKEDWDFSINLNLYAVLNSSKAALDPMVKQKSGTMVFVASDAGRVGENNNCVYSAAKAGVIAFCKALAKELGRYNVRVNCVSPSALDTPGGIILRENLAKRMGKDRAELDKRLLSNYVIRRFGFPQDVADAICFLVSNRADWITGQTLSVNGGYCMI
ncbi:MAG: SDR family NAD(P)-dependent oxidoreductase [Pseudomonadota bacterium]